MKDQIAAPQPTPDITFDYPDQKVLVEGPIDAYCQHIADGTNELQDMVDVFTTVLDLGTNAHEATHHW